VNQSTGAKVLAYLQAFDVKDVGGGRYRSLSPFRSDSDSRSFALIIHADGEHGAYQDHGGNEAGSLYDLARKLGFDLPSGPDGSATTKRAFTGLADYAAAHGAIPQAFTDAGWREGTLGERPVLFFQTANGDRWRFLDGNKPKYGNKTGYKQCWYGLKKAVALLGNSTTKTLLLCNGEPSTVAAQYHLLPTCCLTNSGERSDITPDMLKEFKESFGDYPPTLLVAYDCDTKGRAASIAMANYLTTQGFQARAIDLALGFEGADLADYCKLYGEVGDTLLGRLNQCQTLAEIIEFTPRHKWQIVSRDYMRTLPPVKWLIPDQLQAHAVNVLVGPPKQGKSFLAIDWAATVAQTESVVYMLGEGDRGINPRVTAWEKHHGKLTDKNLHFCKGAVEIMLDSDLDDFIGEIRPLKPKLVIVDTLARSMLMGDENSSKDMKNFIAGCSRMVEELDCTVLLVHHTRKDNGVYRGSNVLEGNVDVMLFLTMQDEVIELKSSALKEQAATDSLYFRLIPKMVDTIEGQVEAAVIIPVDKFKDDGSRLTQNQRAILTLLADDDSETYYRRDLVEILRIPVGTVIQAVKTLKKLGFMESVGKNNPYTITELGRKSLIESTESTVHRGITQLVVTPLDSIESIDTVDTVDSIDEFERYAIKQLGADISPLPVQSAFIQKPVNYG